MLREAEMKEQAGRVKVRMREALTHKENHGEKIISERRVWDWTVRSNIVQTAAK